METDNKQKKQLRELSDEELKQVTGGKTAPVEKPNPDYINACKAAGGMVDAITGLCSVPHIIS